MALRKLSPGTQRGLPVTLTIRRRSGTKSPTAASRTAPDLVGRTLALEQNTAYGRLHVFSGQACSPRTWSLLYCHKSNRYAVDTPSLRACFHRLAGTRILICRNKERIVPFGPYGLSRLGRYCYH